MNDTVNEYIVVPTSRCCNSLLLEYALIECADSEGLHSLNLPILSG